ncbi:MAG: hypothetical protein PHQ23_04970 [Candidatus Wallbacteria bacterium]|nr:hypothetical protein [Candidatus Wallbacteria bacterium]
MGNKAVTLVEILLAVTILALALVPMAGGLLSYFKRVNTIEGSLDYTHRAQNLLNDLLNEVSYKETQRVMTENGCSGENVGALSDHGKAVVKNLTTIKTREGKLLCPPDTGLNADQTTNTEKGKWLVSDKGTYFKMNGVSYYFTLTITNIPLQFHWKQYVLDVHRKEVVGWLDACTRSNVPGKPDVKTTDSGGVKRDMFQQLTLDIRWQEYGRNLSYSFVTFKANLDDANDTHDNSTDSDS